jgi:uncharacterized protein (TIGR03435 family)
MSTRLTGLCLLPLLSALAQTPAFEVASVRPSAPDGERPNIQRDPAGGITLTNVDLQTLVSMAYNIQPFQLAGGPPWLRSRRFDVVAKAPAATDNSRTWVMLQALLADRFQLVVHKETPELPVFELVVARGGLKMQPAHRPPSPADDFIQTSPGKMKAMMVTMQGLSMTLSGVLGHRVIDRTGVDGRYDFQLSFAPDDTNASDRPSIYSALQEQLGLHLQRSEGKVEVTVIDRVELPAEN